MSAFAIVLDMDGLMVDSEPMSRRTAWDQVLGRYGHTLDDATYSGIIGYRIDESALMLISTYDLPVDVNDLVREKTETLANIRSGGVPVMPGLYEFYTSVERHGLPWGVATSSPRSHAEEILAQLGLGSSCRAIAGGDEVKHGKPAPDIYLLAAERLKVPVRQCMALEDSIPGCQSARAAGMMVVAVPNRDTRAADFSLVDHVFSSLHYVDEMFDSLLGELARR